MFQKIKSWFKKPDPVGDKYALVQLRTVIDFVYWDGDFAKYTYPDTQSLVKIHDGLTDLKVGSWWDGKKWHHPKD